MIKRPHLHLLGPSLTPDRPRGTPLRDGKTHFVMTLCALSFGDYSMHSGCQNHA